ncbi:MAG: hypothetical protein H0X25_08475 [Acidobacteriales bacterium]|nr:hypothetical protein [Terriglobales bacterium]
MTSGALLVHGYHPYAEDAEIYLPGVLKQLHPELYPFNADFFEAHAHMTLFPRFVAEAVRLSHLSLETTMFVLQMASYFLLLLACWRMSGLLFRSGRARWGAVGLVAALFTIPIAGTALYLMDQYLNPRNLVAFAAVYALVMVLEKKYVRCGAFCVVAGLFHPLMAVFVIFLAALLVILQQPRWGWLSAGCLLPFGFSLDPPSAAYHEAMRFRPYHYFLQWHWYEMFGVAASMALLWVMGRVARAKQLRKVALVCRALLVYEAVCVVAAIVLALPRSLEAFARIQPMRSLYLLFLLMLLVLGGMLGEFVLRGKAWRWAALFVPLCAGMFLAQRALFPASAHLELPGRKARNPWLQAFLWIRSNTPVNAVFALDPGHMGIEGEDENGFRAAAERSMLADELKDSGAVSMFPQLAGTWLSQVKAQQGWTDFERNDFERLRRDYGVSWVVVQGGNSRGLDCPFGNDAVLVCAIN